MEHDRYKQHPTLYITGLICLVLSLCLFAFSFYVLPFLLFDWVYDVPEFLLHAREWLHQEFGHEYNLASFFIFLFFFLLAIITGSIARKASVQVDKPLYDRTLEQATTETEQERQKEKRNKEIKESAAVASKILFLLAVVLIALTLFEMLLYIEPPQN